MSVIYATALYIYILNSLSFVSIRGNSFDVILYLYISFKLCCCCCNKDFKWRSEEDHQRNSEGEGEGEIRNAILFMY